MKVGDLVWVACKTAPGNCGMGIYLGPGVRGSGWAKRSRRIHKFLWKGRIATFDFSFWQFEVLSEV